jgi:hypothetical protein
MRLLCVSKPIKQASHTDAPLIAAVRILDELRRLEGLCLLAYEKGYILALH